MDGEYAETQLRAPGIRALARSGAARRREVALVDPAWDVPGLLEHLARQDLKLVAALVTHYHPDHVGGSFGQQPIQGLAELMARNPVKIYANRHEAEDVKKVTGVSDSDLVKVDSGDKLTLGAIEIEFLHPATRCSSRAAAA
ncbi:MAG: MBL fold metallo-hydrolase [Betaproteobacteria bacterium]